jgi:hypothetical protein
MWPYYSNYVHIKISKALPFCYFFGKKKVEEKIKIAANTLINEPFYESVS